MGMLLGESRSEVVRDCDDGLDFARKDSLALRSYLQAADQEDIGKVSNNF
jgi:hypothetical protein